MLNTFKNGKCLLMSAAIGLAACGADAPSSSTVQPQEKPRAQVTPQQNPPQVAAVKPDYDFERKLQSCVLYSCKLLPAERMKVTDYNPDLITGLGLSTQDTQREARNKFAGFYSGTASTSLGNTTDRNLTLVHAQLSPGNNPALHEYDIFIRTNGAHNGAKVKDWGARVRCAPVAETTAWQTTPCR